MEPITMIWLAGIVVFIILEAVTYQIVSVWFAVGAIGGLIANALGADFKIQLIVFAVISAICLLCLRPLSRKLIKPKKENTNVDSLLGKTVLITGEVDNIRGTGEGKVGGMTWTVRSADNSVIPEGETVICERVEGVKLIVKRVERPF